MDAWLTKDQKQILDILNPVMSWDIPKTKANLQMAKTRLIDVLRVVKVSKPPKDRCSRELLYLVSIGRIYDWLNKGDYLAACYETGKFIYEDWTEVSNNGFIYMLEEVERGRFDAK